MRKSYAFAFSLTLLLAATVATAVATTTLKESANIGETIANFKLPDVKKGKEHSLDALKGKQGTVLIFVSVQCPVSNAYNERMQRLAQDYKARGINVIGINANATESSNDVGRHATQHKFTFPILKDTNNKIADRLGATVTPEAFLLDASGKLVYHGRIDNSKETSGINSNDLRDAINQTLEGKSVAKTTARAFGCTIKRVKQAS